MFFTRKVIALETNYKLIRVPISMNKRVLLILKLKLQNAHIWYFTEYGMGEIRLIDAV